LESTKKKGINFEMLIREREGIKQTKSKEPQKISLGEYDFLLYPFSEASGYPFLIPQHIRSILILKGFVKRISFLKQVLLFWTETNASPVILGGGLGKMF